MCDERRRMRIANDADTRTKLILYVTERWWDFLKFIIRFHRSSDFQLPTVRPTAFLLIQQTI